MRFLCLIIFLSICAMLCARPTPSLAADTFTMWQLPEQTYSQMMSYVIRTTDDKIIVIDGGMPGDAPYLRGFLAALGNRVDVWIITHLHDDHMGALMEILARPADLKIGRIYASMPDDAWVKEVVPEGEREPILQFKKVLESADRKAINLRIGRSQTIGGIKFEVLGVCNPEFHANCINNSSIVLRASDTKKSVLFLGDLGPEGGEKLLRKYGDRLKSDYVQMAHHGQNGVGLTVYKAIQPTYCLWPTPTWLWDNNINGKGKGSGPWKTLEVRQWMEDLQVKKNYVSADGLVRID